jgi:hypothetical protein
VLSVLFLQPVEGGQQDRPEPIPTPVPLQAATNARLIVEGQNCQVGTDAGLRIVNLRFVLEGMLQIAGQQVIAPDAGGGALVTFKGEIPPASVVTVTVNADDRPAQVVPRVQLKGSFLAVARVTPPIVTFTTGPVIELAGAGFTFQLGDRTVSTGPWTLTALDVTLLRVMISPDFPQIGWIGRIEAQADPKVTFANVSGCEFGGTGQRVTIVRSGSVDIKPGSFPNPVNPSSRGVVPVAILGGQHLDVRSIDIATIEIDDDRLPGGGVAPGRDRRRIEDVNGDGFLDLSLNFITTALNQAGLLGDKRLFVSGALGTGPVQVIGSDVICVPGNCAP